MTLMSETGLKIGQLTEFAWLAVNLFSNMFCVEALRAGLSKKLYHVRSLKKTHTRWEVILEGRAWSEIIEIAG